MVVRRPAHVAKSPIFCPKGVVVKGKREIVEGKGGKEGEGSQSATNLWMTSHAWPPLNPYFHPPLHLVPLMLTSKTKSIKSKANSFHLFPKFFLFIFEIFRFILCNDEINMQWKRSKKMGDERGRDKNQICKRWKKGGK
jgi:hypothetical protein